MRRVRNQKATSNNPAIVFAIGVEKIISDKLSDSSQNSDQEIRNIQNITNKKAPYESPFIFLFRQVHI